MSLLLLTGASGMLGSAVLQTLVDVGRSPLRAVWHHTPPHIRHPEVEYLQGDLRDPQFCRQAAEGVTHALLTAAHTGGAAEARTHPWRQVNPNLEMNIHLFEALARNQRLEHLIFVSSATVYQPFEGHIREEQLDLNQPPASAHLGVGLVMRHLEQMCRFWQQVSGARFQVVRAANIFGPYAPFDPARSNFIPALIRKAVAAQDPFEGWGNPATIRDVIYAPDVAEALLALLRYQGEAWEAFNVGSGQQVSVQNVLDWVLRFAAHQPAAFAWLGDRHQTIPFRALDCTKIKVATGWQAHTPIEIGLQKTLEWWKTNQFSWNR